MSHEVINLSCLFFTIYKYWLVIKKKRYIVLWLCLFCLGIGILLGYRLWQVKRFIQPFVAQNSHFVLSPPAEAIEGNLVQVQGRVELLGRDNEDWKVVNPGEKLLQGESLATKELSYAKVEFPQFYQLDLYEEGNIDLVNLIPENFLINQTSGVVAYRQLQEQRPVNVRALHALLTIYGGETEVDIQTEEININVLSGKGKLVMVDLDNQTQVWELTEGQEVLIDDRERRVEIK